MACLQARSRYERQLDARIGSHPFLCRSISLASAPFSILCTQKGMGLFLKARPGLSSCNQGCRRNFAGIETEAHPFVQHRMSAPSGLRKRKRSPRGLDELLDRIFISHDGSSEDEHFWRVKFPFGMLHGPWRFLPTSLVSYFHLTRAEAATVFTTLSADSFSQRKPTRSSLSVKFPTYAYSRPGGGGERGAGLRSVKNHRCHSSSSTPHF